MTLLGKHFADGLIYWSREPIQANRRIFENSQRNLLQPKYEEEWDSHAVEATAYALLVYLIRDGIRLEQERIVKWLNGMRMHDAGFISTVVSTVKSVISSLLPLILLCFVLLYTETLLLPCIAEN